MGEGVVAMALEKMDDFFDTRADTYDHHMLVDWRLMNFITK